MTVTSAPASGGGPLLRNVLGRQRRPVVLMSLAGISHQACEALVPVVIGVIVDRAIEPSDAGALLRWLVLLALLFGLLTASWRTFATVGARALQQSEHDLRMRLTGRILDPGGLALSAAEDGRDVGVSASTGSLLNVAGADAAQAALVVRAVGSGAAVLSALLVSAIVLLGISLPLGLLVLVGTPLLVVLLQRLAVPLRARSATDQARAADASAVATDLVQGVRVLKGIGAESTAVERYRRASRTSLRATLRAAIAGSVLDAANVLISGVLLAVVAYVGGRMAVEGTISVGDLVAAVGVTQFLVGPLQRVGYVAGMLAEARASADRVAAVLSAPPTVGDGPAAAPDPVAGTVRIADARSGPGAPPLALTAAAGEQLGVVAADPRDATVLLDLLARRVDPATGHVALDATDLRELSLADAHRLLLVADHEADLFEGTIAENVLAVAPGLAAGQRDAVLVASGADELVAVLPGGLDAPVGERGRVLSGGQRQRVALARALAADPPVLVLHEPTTAVDSVTEARIADGLRRLRAGRTTIVVTSSPTLLAACDRVVLIERGAVTAEGTHHELGLEHDGYREAVLG